MFITTKKPRSPTFGKNTTFVAMCSVHLMLYLALSVQCPKPLVGKKAKCIFGPATMGQPTKFSSCRLHRLYVVIHGV